MQVAFKRGYYKWFDASGKFHKSLTPPQEENGTSIESGRGDDAHSEDTERLYQDSDRSVFGGDEDRSDPLPDSAD